MTILCWQGKPEAIADMWGG